MKKIKLVKGQITQRKGNSIIIFDAEKSLLYTFNSTATFMFDRLKKGVTYDELLHNIIAEFSVDEKKAKDDLDKFIQELVTKGIAKEE